MIDPLIGTLVLGRHRVVKSLAVGGMGVIYLGRSEGSEGFAKPVVIKRIVSAYAASDSDAREFFVREAKILAQIRHPGIVGVVDFGEEDGGHAMVLEYVHGYHLGQWLRYFRRREVPFPAEIAIFAMGQVLDALDHAHRLAQPDGRMMRVVHRDATPSNVLIDLDGHVKLADFGIARISQSEDDLTQSGLLRGKLPYLAPELLHGAAASVSSDLYSVAVMLHEALVGKNEWKTAVPAEVVRLVLEHRPSRVEDLRSDVPVGIDAVLERALAKDPKARFATARDFRDALRALPLPDASELVRSFRRQVRRDFEGELPTLLGLDSLSERESAWRVVREWPAKPANDGSPPDVEPESTRRVNRRAVLEATDPSNANGEAAATGLGERAVIDLSGGRLGRPDSTPTERSSVPSVDAVDVDGEAAAKPALSRSGLLAIVVLSALVAVTLARVTLRPHVTGPRYVVVSTDPQEAPALDPRSDGQSAVASSSGPTTTDSSPRSAPTDSNGTHAATDVSPVAKLTRAFATRRSDVRACFATHADLAGAPSTVDIHFQVGTDGEVVSASLDPPALARSALGRCLVGVARSTRFPPSASALRFSIPVTAAAR